MNLIKIWQNIKKKTLKSRNNEKLSSKYNINENIEQLSDNESDKTDEEISNNNIYINRGRKANSARSTTNSNNNNKNYNKRDKSLDIIRNKEDEYEIVMPYQRYIKKIK